jgi:hypothetical protein
MLWQGSHEVADFVGSLCVPTNFLRFGIRGCWLCARSFATIRHWVAVAMQMASFFPAFYGLQKPGKPAFA